MMLCRFGFVKNFHDAISHIPQTMRAFKGHKIYFVCEVVKVCCHGWDIIPIRLKCREKNKFIFCSDRNTHKPYLDEKLVQSGIH